MITAATPAGLGFSPFSALKTVARTAARVATNPNVQRAAVAAGQAYAPEQYAQAQQYAAKARHVYRTVIGPNGRPIQVAADAPTDMPPVATDSSPEPGGKSGGGMLTLAAIGGGLLLVLLLTRG